MSQLFKKQTNIAITLETSYDISAATVHRILYVKPNGQKGYWEATVSGTKLLYNAVNGEINKAGLWKFQAYVEIGGLKAYGEITTQNFANPID